MRHSSERFVPNSVAPLIHLARASAASLFLMRRHAITFALIVSFLAGNVFVSPSSLVQAAPPAPVTAEEAAEIARDAYVYAFPLVLMDVSRQVMTNSETVDVTKNHGPINQFVHMPAFPDAKFTDVVRPNADTLYSSLWTDIFSSTGKRTTGTGPQTYAICGPGWSGKLPEGVTPIMSPTGFGWMIGRTQTNGKEDYDAVHKFQAGLKAVPLCAWGKGDYTPPKGVHDPKLDMSAPSEQVTKMKGAEFFARFAEVMKANPPHANDYPILMRMARIGIVPGKSFDAEKAPAEVQAAIAAAPAAGFKSIASYTNRAGRIIRGWMMVANPIGTYGTDYRKRALVAYMGLGANVVEDAIYPTANDQADKKPFDSASRYVLHFEKNQIPPARAFWSLTMYNEDQFFADNPINRYAIGDRNKLKFNKDGSLDLYIQRESPGKTKESNWLPAPAKGSFSMNLRLYWPKEAALDGTWTPPAVQRLAK